MDIAKRGGMLYDKLCGFVDDLQVIGGRIKQAQESYDLALGKLSTGNGNAIQQALKLKELGASTTKNLPDTLTLSQGDTPSLGLIDDSDQARTNTA
jgi:DNA recombination protein RmuC